MKEKSIQIGHDEKSLKVITIYPIIFTVCIGREIELKYFDKMDISRYKKGPLLVFELSG